MTAIQTFVKDDKGCFHLTWKFEGQKNPLPFLEKGKQSYKFFSETPIVLIATLTDKDGKLEAIFGIDKSDKQYQLYP